MGTSSPYSGPNGDKPLIPSWLGSGDFPDTPPASDGAPPNAPPTPAPPIPPAPSNQPAIPAAGASNRFTSARSNFTRFAHSGGNDRRSLGRAVSGYVSTSSGGARSAAQHMGASRGAGARLLNFLTDAQARGSREALRTLNLEAVSGRPIQEVFLALADYVCPNAGTVDEGIAREAFIETIIDLTTLGVTDLDALTPDQMQTVFELYATHAIEARLCNDIGTKLITAPINADAALRVQRQLQDFIRNAVSDALTAARAATPVMTIDRVQAFVDAVYERAFGILQALGDAEANR